MADDDTFDDEAARQRSEFMDHLDQIGTMVLDPGFPAVVSDEFRGLATAALEYMELAAQAGLGEERLALDGLLSFEEGFRADGLGSCAEGCRRIRARGLLRLRQRAASN